MLIAGGYPWQPNDKSNPPTSTAQSLAAPKPWKASAVPRPTPANMDSHPKPSPPTPNRLTLSTSPSPNTWPSSARPHPANSYSSIKWLPRKFAGTRPGPLKQRPGTEPSPRTMAVSPGPSNRWLNLTSSPASCAMRLALVVNTTVLSNSFCLPASPVCQTNRIDPRSATRFCRTNRKCQPHIRPPEPILRNEPDTSVSLVAARIVAFSRGDCMAAPSGSDMESLPQAELIYHGPGFCRPTRENAMSTRLSFVLFILSLVSLHAQSGWKSLFDGKTLNGWEPLPTFSLASTGDWKVE
jgi:hypothetical protein